MLHIHDVVSGGAQTRTDAMRKPRASPIAAIQRLLSRAAGSYSYHRVFRSRRKFSFQGKEYRYLCHPYNGTWYNERALEIPIVRDLVEQHRGKRVLEVGNVLGHYFQVRHDRVDKFEQADGVLNQDIVDFRPCTRYDLIVSISTLEHVGWDEEPREPDKVLRAVEGLRRLLAPGGRMVVTLPLGYNPELDDRLRDGRLSFTRRFSLKRISADNRWKETSWDEIREAKFNAPFRRTNGLVIGVIENPHSDQLPTSRRVDGFADGGLPTSPTTTPRTTGPISSSCSSP
jgi:SAM-dependent methyltransferase